MSARHSGWSFFSVSGPFSISASLRGLVVVESFVHGFQPSLFVVHRFSNNVLCLSRWHTALPFVDHCECLLSVSMPHFFVLRVSCPSFQSEFDMFMVFL